MILGRLLAQGDLVSIERGRLVIRPASGLPVPPEWLAKHEQSLICEILAACGRSGFRFVRKGKVGRFDNGKSPGIYLSFVNVATGEEFYSIPNVLLTYQRGKKSGQPLPAGRFYPEDGSAFMKLWRSAGLDDSEPSEIWKRVGKLSASVLCGSVHESKPGKLVAGSLRAITISAAEVAEAVGKESVSSRFLVGNLSVRVVGKETQQSSEIEGQEPDSNCVSVELRKKKQVISKELSLPREVKEIQTPLDDFDSECFSSDPLADCPRDPNIKTNPPAWMSR